MYTDRADQLLRDTAEMLEAIRTSNLASDLLIAGSISRIYELSPPLTYKQAKALRRQAQHDPKLAAQLEAIDAIRDKSRRNLAALEQALNLQRFSTG
jgi:chromosomal replication initiation ATPase DnaA